MSFFGCLLQMVRGRPRTDENKLHMEVRAAVHQYRDDAQRAIASAVLSAKSSDRIYSAAHRAIKIMEAARGSDKCDD